MKNKFLIINSKILLIIILINFNVLAQCPPDDFPNDYVVLASQEDVDNFIIDYPDCTTLQTLLIGDTIPGSTITNLNGLINLMSIGWLQITTVPLVNLEGLNNVSSIDRFVIYYMEDLLSLEGLDSLETVTGPEFNIELCLSLTSLIGLENLSSFGGDYFKIINNLNLIDSSGLDCYFFTEEFRNGVSNYEVQPSLYQSIFDNCGIVILSNEDFIANNIRFYPNPVENVLNIDGSENFEGIYVFDMSGRLVMHKTSNFNSIDLSDIATGSYILQFRLDSNKVLNNKLIIE